MKKIIAFFIAFVFVIPCASWGAINVKSSGIKKAAPVATKQADKMESVTSLLPTVIGLVGSFKALNQQQQQLSADCVPTSSELQLVNDLMKEYAKIGVTTASALRGTKAKPCNGNFNSNNESGYSEFLQRNEGTDDSCIETFSSDASKGTIWLGFPKASSGKVCDIVDTDECKNISNIYDVFALIPFTEEDYTKSEATKIAQFKAKAERCAPGKIEAARRELYGNFVTQTLGNLGSGSGAAGTASVLEAVSSMGGSGNIQSMLPSLGTMATQMLDK